MKFSNFIVGLVFLIFIVSFTYGQEPQPGPLTVKDAIQLALTNQPILNEAKDYVNAAASKVEEQKSFNFPQVDVNLSYAFIGPIPSIEIPFGGSFDLAPSNNYNANISIGYLLFDFNRRNEMIDIVKSNKLTQEEKVDLIKNQLAYRTVQMFYAIKFFENKGDQYKLEILSEIDENSENVSLYKEGEFVDLCRGPHIPSAGKIKYVKLLNISGSYWRGDEHNKQLQRIYGISFPKKKMLDEHLALLEEAKKRDHRKLGKELELFYFTPKVGAGLPLWLPKGTVLRETLENYLREEQLKRGYLPVVTPHIGNIELYKTSGHYPYYKESQFPTLKFENSTEEYLLRPMNCPHHFQIYSSKMRSYRDLPIRLAEFGMVYRYEQSGELNGLTRVRSFAVDDSHMFVRQDQLKDELCNVIELIQTVFSAVGFADFTTQLSYRDNNTEKYGGEIELWEKAQLEIKAAADEMKLDYKILEGEAAFYGPKIDFNIKDVLGRKWQLGTVQIDYVMPERFDLQYIGSDGKKHRPVVIHRAPFGSLERFIGVLIEHYAGYFPTWLAPVQVSVIPVSQNYIDYAKKIVNSLKENGIRVEIDERNEKIGYKIRECETQKVPYMLILGEKEQTAGNISVRKHKEGDKGTLSITEFIDNITNEIKNKLINQ